MFQEFLLELITSATVSAVLTTLLLFITKSLISERLKNAIKNEYDEKLESHKTKLNAQSDVEIENLKSRLTISTIEHQVKFSDLHKSRAEIIE